MPQSSPKRARSAVAMRPLKSAARACTQKALRPPATTEVPPARRNRQRTTTRATRTLGSPAPCALLHRRPGRLRRTHAGSSSVACNGHSGTQRPQVRAARAVRATRACRRAGWAAAGGGPHQLGARRRQDGVGEEHCRLGGVLGFGIWGARMTGPRGVGRMT